MLTLISTLAPIQLASLIALITLLCLIIAIALFCLVRALRIKVTARPNIKSLDAEFVPNEALYGEHLSAMIKIPTVSTPENTACADEFKSLIFSIYPRLTSHCEFVSFDGGIMLIWKGKNSAEPLVLMSHFDVAPIVGDWEYAPFSGNIVDGIVHGRGSVGTKGNLCAILDACEGLLSEGFMPNRDIIIFSSSKEEVAGTDAPRAAQYLKDKGISPMLVIDEGGAMLDNPLVGVRGNFAMIAMCERSRATITISADTSTALDKFIKKAVMLKLFKPTFSPEVLAMFTELTPYMAFPMKFVFANLWLFKDLLLGLLPKISKEAKAMIIPTIGYSAIQKDETNGKFVATITLASTYYCDIDVCIEKFIDICKRNNILAVIKTYMKTCKPEQLFSGGYSLVADCVRAAFNKVVPSPFILFGGTDARHFADISTSVIRFAPLHLTHKEFGSFHNANEQIHLDAISGAVCFFRELIKKTC